MSRKHRSSVRVLRHALLVGGMQLAPKYEQHSIEAESLNRGADLKE